MPRRPSSADARSLVPLLDCDRCDILYSLRPPPLQRPRGHRSSETVGTAAGWLAAGVTALALTIPFRVQRELRERDFENLAIGYSIWSNAEDGAQFRWAQPRSRFFVPGSAASALVPLRLGAQIAGPVAVNVRLDGRLANRITVASDRWTVVRVVIPPSRRAARYRAIELEIDPPPGTLGDGLSGNTSLERALMVESACHEPAISQETATRCSR